ncbi:hypothetical protein [Seohaeicola zhoushanensis]|uniref:hypothetical protein n=1 Tax=Seohaeicola zhoushanensis TaxID=1569283 RepID=UPI001671BEC1|nr:hypothetical protein [Seohaeicola zhoushanensis]
MSNAHFRFHAGDIVCFRFPRREGPSYARPCLVLQAIGTELVIAYGTTSTTNSNRGLEVSVEADFAACGLDRPTRFVCARRIRVDHTDPRIEPCPDGGTPVIGHLPARYIPQLAGVFMDIAKAFPDPDVRAQAERAGIHPPKPMRGSHLNRRRPLSPPVVVVRATKSFRRPDRASGSAH